MFREINYQRYRASKESTKFSDHLKNVMEIIIIICVRYYKKVLFVEKVECQSFLILNSIIILILL
jgi:hypothetical protein